MVKVHSGKPKGDVFLLFLVAAVSLFGVLMVYSASSYNAKVLYGDEFFFVKKQAIGYAAGLVSMLLFARLDYQKLVRFRIVAPVVALILLALVFVPGIGKESYGAKRWIGFGSFTVQPSELAKYALVLFTAAHFGLHAKNTDRFRTLLPVLGVGGCICVLVILEPNMSVTVCIAAIMAALIFLSGTKLRNVLPIVIPLVLAVPLLIFAEPYRLKRLSAYLDPWASPKGEGYQLIQSLYALGGGGLFGKGLFGSVQKYRFLPFAESDFILAVIGEELGFVGIVLFFAVYALISYRAFRIAARCADVFGYLLSSGITLVYAVQTVLNALVVSGTIPPTGLPLPLISSGNTSLIVTMASFGVLYNISAQNAASRLLSVSSLRSALPKRR